MTDNAPDYDQIEAAWLAWRSAYAVEVNRFRDMTGDEFFFAIAELAPTILTAPVASRSVGLLMDALVEQARAGSIAAAAAALVLADDDENDDLPTEEPGQEGGPLHRRALEAAELCTKRSADVRDGLIVEGLIDREIAAGRLRAVGADPLTGRRGFRWVKP